MVDVPVALVVQVPLYLAATWTLFGVRLWSTGLWIFLEMTSGIISVLSTLWFDSGYMWTFGDDFGFSPYSALSLVRQQKHALRQFTELLMKLTFFLRAGRLGSPYAALCLVQLPIHALRQSTAAWDFHGVSP